MAFICPSVLVNLSSAELILVSVAVSMPFAGAYATNARPVEEQTHGEPLNKMKVNGYDQPEIGSVIRAPNVEVGLHKEIVGLLAPMDYAIDLHGFGQ